MQDGDQRSRGPGFIAPPPEKRPRFDDLSANSLTTASQNTSIPPDTSAQQSVMEGLIALPSTQTANPVNSQATFNMSSILEQPLVFDFGTSPQTSIRRPQESQIPTTTVDSGPVRLGTETSPQDLGHGTLVMSKSGAASRYFGHTAASEWLKDVRTWKCSRLT